MNGTSMERRSSSAWDVAHPARYRPFSGFGRVCRLGLATRGNTRLDPEDVHEAIRRGVNFLNWCGHPDGMSVAIRSLALHERRKIYVSVQLKARTPSDVLREMTLYADELGVDYIDGVTWYYVESREEWREITVPQGAMDALQAMRREGRVRDIGLTSHQRRLAADFAASGMLDFLMIRYNAAHRGAEEDVFPVTSRMRMPVVTYTGLRWGTLLRTTPDDPADFSLPGAPEWYRFVLCHPDVSVSLMAPNGRAELEEDLTLLDDWHGCDHADYQTLLAHGDRVHRHGGGFP